MSSQKNSPPKRIKTFCSAPEKNPHKIFLTYIIHPLEKFSLVLKWF